MAARAAAFMSYVAFDDQHNDGQLSRLRERLSAEVRVLTGEEFSIFPDRNDIAWGQNWQQRVDESLDASTLLLAIVTPSFFRSTSCRAEVNQFLERERALGRQDLILPIYYIGAWQLDDGADQDDDLTRLLMSRPFEDWRDLRFEPFTAPVVRRAVAQVAARMRDAFWHPAGAAPAPMTARIQEATPAKAEPSAERRATAVKAEPPTHVVDVHQRGDFTTVSAAIDAARPGDRILVKPGLYSEGLTVTKPLEILGDGDAGDVEIRATGSDALVFQATMGRVANLTLRQAGGAGHWYAVDIMQGRLDLEGCDISSQSYTCVSIRNDADPRLHRNIIHHGRRSGICVFGNGRGTLEDNEIYGHDLAGVEIRTGGNPVLRRNQVHEEKQVGVYVFDGGLGVLEDNDIYGNGLAGVEILGGGRPTLRRNRINDNEESGVYSHDGGDGVLDENDISANGRAGVEIKSSGHIVARGNHINRNRHEGVRVYDGGSGVIEDNDLSGNVLGAWNIAPECEGKVTRTGNRQ